MQMQYTQLLRTVHHIMSLLVAMESALIKVICVTDMMTVEIIVMKKDVIHHTVR